MALTRYIYTVQEVDLTFEQLPSVKTFEYQNDASDYFDSRITALQKQFPEADETALDDFDAAGVYCDDQGESKYMIILQRQELLS
ncbi:hypothetical protein [Limosilactobacillus kribbianus]|uniref:hypothetical protein n=1 Tax=Limosilactobacillus kribbianus TaxID=2982695 RepID=UPI002264687A|nr:hypothetical protein [Limosilactobacillus kribbianus]